MMDDLTDLYQQVILDHSRSPRNFGPMKDASRRAEGHNPLCGDNIVLYVKLAGDRVEDVRFEGSGCAIFKASASILTEALKGKRLEEVKKLFGQVHDMVRTGRRSGEEMDKLVVFAGVHKFPARVKCAILPWHAALAAVEGTEDPVSTE